MRKEIDIHDGGTVVLLGSLSTEAPGLGMCVREFGWVLKNAESIGSLEHLAATGGVVAVLFEPRAFGASPVEAVQRVRKAAQGALPLVCHRFSEPVDWPELAEAGAFHSLPVPLDAREIRQALGFVWAAKGFRARNVIPLRRRLPRRAQTVSEPVTSQASVS